jgi:hypothetical protein
MQLKKETKGMKYNDPDRVRIWKECPGLQAEYYKELAVEDAEWQIYKKSNSVCLRKFTIGK